MKSVGAVSILEKTACKVTLSQIELEVEIELLKGNCLQVVLLFSVLPPPDIITVSFHTCTL